MLPSIFRILATLGAIQNRQILKNLKILKIPKISYVLKDLALHKQFSKQSTYDFIKKQYISIFCWDVGTGAAGGLVSAV